MTTKWYMPPFCWVIYLLAQPEVAHQLQQKKSLPTTTKEGCTKVWNMSPLTWSQHRKQFQRKADEEKKLFCVSGMVDGEVNDHSMLGNSGRAAYKNATKAHQK